MKKQISLLAAFCLLISLLPMSAWATTLADLGLTQVFGLTISKNESGYAVVGNSMKQDAAVSYGGNASPSAASDDVPAYGETASGVPYLKFATITENKAKDHNTRNVSVEVDVDKAETTQHETIADMNIAVEMWIRPYASSVKLSTTRYGIFSLKDSVAGSTYAIDHGLVSGATPWAGNSFLPVVKATSAENSTAVARTSTDGYNTDADATAYAGLNDGEWVHFVITRYYVQNSNGSVTLHQGVYVNGKHIGDRKITSDSNYNNVVGNYESLTKDGTNYLNYNMVTLGKGGGFGYAFNGDIAVCNIYTADNWASVTDARNGGKAIYDTNSLTSKMNSGYTASTTLTDGNETEYTDENIADASTITVTAEINDFVEHAATADIATATPAAQMALAVGYAESGKLICTGSLTTEIDFYNKKTIASGTLTVPTGETLHNVKVFVWNNADGLRPITAAYSLR